MNILGIVGSPRINGNTSKMVSYLLEGAKKSGHTTRIIYLNELDFQGCQGCYGCSRSYTCVLKDDLVDVYDAINLADEIILGSPIYMWQISGQLKMFIDRLLPYYMKHSNNEPIDKKVVFAFSQEDRDAMVNMEYIKLMEQSIERIGFKFKDTFVAGGNVKPDDIDKKTELLLKLKSYYHMYGSIMC